MVCPNLRLVEIGMLGFRFLEGAIMLLLLRYSSSFSVIVLILVIKGCVYFFGELILMLLLRLETPDPL